MLVTTPGITSDLCVSLPKARHFIKAIFLNKVAHEAKKVYSTSEISVAKFYVFYGAECSS